MSSFRPTASLSTARSIQCRAKNYGTSLNHRSGHALHSVLPCLWHSNINNCANRNRVPCCIRPVDFRFIHFPTSYFFVEYVTHHRIPLSFHICLAHGHSIGCRTCTPSVVNHSHGCICRMRPCTPIRKSPDARRRDTILQYTGFQTACIARPQTLYTPFVYTAFFSSSRSNKVGAATCASAARM